MLLGRLGLSCNGAAYGYSDITAWASATHQKLNAWQVEALHHLSKTYAVSLSIYANNKTKPAPYASAERLKRMESAVERSWMKG